MPIPTQQTPTTAPAAPTPPAIDAPATTALQARVQSLTDELGVLANQSATLSVGIGQTHGRQRDLLRTQLRDVNGRLTDVSQQLANAETQLAFQHQQLPGDARPGTVIPPTPPDFGRHSRPFDPDLAAGLMFALIFAVLMPISIGYSRRLWRRGAAVPAPPPDNISPRLERLEQAVDAVAIEIERISEGQRFVTRVLAERPLESRVPPASESRDAAGAGDAKAFRALGAGPIEPVRAAERQSVRQSITPH